MRNRIMAAWKVLRGEWTASAPAPATAINVYVDHDLRGTATTANPVTFTGCWWPGARR